MNGLLVVPMSAPSAPLSGCVQFGPLTDCTVPVSVWNGLKRFGGFTISGDCATAIPIGSTSIAATIAAPASAAIEPTAVRCGPFQTHPCFVDSLIDLSAPFKF